MRRNKCLNICFAIWKTYKIKQDNLLFNCDNYVSIRIILLRLEYGECSDF